MIDNKSYDDHLIDARSMSVRELNLALDQYDHDDPHPAKTNQDMYDAYFDVLQQRMGGEERDPYEDDDPRLDMDMPQTYDRVLRDA
jgi:hypothetical protein